MQIIDSNNSEIIEDLILYIASFCPVNHLSLQNGSGIAPDGSGGKALPRIKYSICIKPFRVVSWGFPDFFIKN